MTSRLNYRNSLLSGLPPLSFPPPRPYHSPVHSHTLAGASRGNACIVALLCSKSPVMGHVSRGKAKAFRDLHNLALLVSDLISYCPPPPSAPATWVFLRLEDYMWAPISGHQHLLCCLPGGLFSRAAHAALCLLHGCLPGPPTEMHHTQPQPGLGSFFVFFPPWDLLLATILRNCLICFNVCILSLQCKLHAGKHLYLFCLVMYLECLSRSLAYSSMSEGQE